LQGKTEDLKKLFPDHKPENSANGVDYRDYEGRQNYVAMMYAVDRGIAQIRKALADPNGDGDAADSMVENTIIVFLSDNGGKILQAGNNAPLQDDKGSTMEGGIRVPMFFHWPWPDCSGNRFRTSGSGARSLPHFCRAWKRADTEGKDSRWERRLRLIWRKERTPDLLIRFSG
jgi:hypothetical protein